MAKVDFITLANIIFKDKDKYQYISDEEKEALFFMLNRKYGFKYLKQAQFFNNKNVDKASALDIWYQIFYKTTNGTPPWWWKTKQQSVKLKSDISSSDLKLFKDFYKFKNSDIEFLVKYEKEKLIEDIKRIKKFKKD